MTNDNKVLNIRQAVCALAISSLLAAAGVSAQQPTGLSAEERDKRIATEKELQAIAVVDRKVMMPMRDGVRLATDIYRPKDASGPVPIVFVRTPYNFNFWDVRNGVPADMTAALAAVKRGYAYVVQNERGHFFSEGHYDILGAPTTDGVDAIEWLSKRPWSNGKIGTTGCSSTAEYQLAIAALGHPAYAAMNVQGFGAGVGRMKPYYEQGNWYRGGAVQMLFIAWLYGEQNQVRPMFQRDTPQEDLVSAARLFDLAPNMPPVDWSKALWHLPAQDIYKNVNGPARHLRGCDAGADRRPYDSAGAQRPCLVQRGAVARRSADQSARPVVHVLVRRVGRPEPGDVQPRSPDGEAGRCRSAVGHHRAGRALLRTPAPRRTRSSGSEAWATRGSTTTRSPTGSLTSS